MSKSSSSTIFKTCWTLTNFEHFTTWVGNETCWLSIDFFYRRFHLLKRDNKGQRMQNYLSQLCPTFEECFPWLGRTKEKGKMLCYPFY
jgi:hypothetical protein